jgi:hypothetical protein
MSTYEMLERIHVLEKRLKESEFWREKYADEIIQLKPENAKLRELVRHMDTQAEETAHRGTGGNKEEERGKQKNC